MRDTIHEQGKGQLRTQAFTLVETMIVVSIVGLMATLALPSLRKAQQQTLVVTFVNDLRAAHDAFEMYAMQRGSYPPDANRGVVPAGMTDYMPKRIDWTGDTPLGGKWDWEGNSCDVTAGISVVTPLATSALLRDVDTRIDNGNLATGKFRFNHGDRYTYVIAE